jgi:putative transposase
MVNRRNDWTGHLWANRFHSTLLDSAHLLRAARYVELNPVRAGLTKSAEDYPWSSARANVRGERDSLLSPRRPFPEAVGDWRAWLSQGIEDDELETLRVHTATGRPCGAPEFVRELERRLGRRLRPFATGRRKLLAGEQPESPSGDGPAAPTVDRPPVGKGGGDGGGDSSLK